MQVKKQNYSKDITVCNGLQHQKTNGKIFSSNGLESNGQESNGQDSNGQESNGQESNGKESKGTESNGLEKYEEQWDWWKVLPPNHSILHWLL